MKRVAIFLFTLTVALQVAAGPSPKAYSIKMPSGETLQATVCADGIFRLRVSSEGEFPQSLMERYGILKTDWEEVPVSVSEDDKRLSLSTRTNVLRIDKESGAIVLMDFDGCVLAGPIAFEGGGSGLSHRLADVIMDKFGDLVVRRNSPIIGDDDGTLSEKDKTEAGDPDKSSVLRISIGEEERFYGGGSTSREHIQHRGELLRMWATYQMTEIPMPFVMSSRGWGVYNNSTRKSYFDIASTEKDCMNIYTTSPEADFYLMAGSSMPDVLNAYTLLTGRNYLLPKWAYGFCFGPQMREDQWDILSDAIRFREHDVPCDVLWLEPQWMDKHYDFSTEKRWNYDKFTPEPFYRQKKYPKQYYPNLFIGKLNSLGYHLGLWICEEYDTSVIEEDAIEGAVPSGQEHWMDHLKPFIDLGVEGFKMDPARTLDEHLYFRYYNGRPDKEMHNLNQVLLPKQMAGMYRTHTGKRGWYHYCGGWSGTQHWGASTSGDNGGGKVALFDQLNLGNSGYMNTSCDVMFVPAEEEMQSLHFGTFLPWIQVNSWVSMMHPFYYPKDQEDIYRKCIKLRYNLLPYIYSMAIEGALTGMPMVRSMPLVFPEDRMVDDMASQYMFGQSLCVGIFTDEIYLPEGTWTDAWTDEKIISRGETIRRKYPSDRAGLLFIRGGAMIPTMDAVDYIGTKPLTAFTLKVYPEGDSTYTLYDCDAESYGYEEGLVAATRLECCASSKSVRLTVNPVEGRFENMPASRSWAFEFHLDKKPSRVILNGKKLKGWTFERGVLKISPVSRAESDKLEILIYM